MERPSQTPSVRHCAENRSASFPKPNCPLLSLVSGRPMALRVRAACSSRNQPLCLQPGLKTKIAESEALPVSAGKHTGPWKLITKFSDIKTADGAIVATCNNLTGLCNMKITPA